MMARRVGKSTMHQHHWILEFVIFGNALHPNLIAEGVIGRKIDQKTHWYFSFAFFANLLKGALIAQKSRSGKIA